MRANLGLSVPVMAATAAAIVSPDGTGRLPALGWNSWNEYACDISEEVFIRVADLFVEYGLQDLGYEYVNIDDCWSNRELRRDNVTGRIIPDYVKFPNGIHGLAEQIHARGLKLGIYGDAGTLTCGGFEGSLGFEQIDADTFAEWGVDYLKYDNCNVPEEWTDEYIFYPEHTDNAVPPPGYWYGDSRTAERYNAMRDALLDQNRTVQYSLCAWGHARVETWGNETGHSWRMWGDIVPEWKGQYTYSWGLVPIITQAARHWNDTDFWGHNDWDMLEVGNGNLTLAESRTHFAMWAAFKSPLIIGTRLEGITQPVLDILRNKELIAFNQDPVYGVGVRPFNYGCHIPIPNNETEHPPSHYVGSSTKGIHLFLLNSYESERSIDVAFDEVPGLRSLGEDEEYIVHDMWTGKDIGVFKGSYTATIESHDTAALRITTIHGE
ncbi:hypothetical protein S40285_09031 [Stachybotrys chlorohalonatus IBT 40285]|uniref:Alpha-galactosidase n=1 Tax=Stachybotrys chlorohalonatus (strain IBT 40285) TaxID=1283841 RepID=A0A084QWK4_STAC4|nr:hypothetical protein S40285_09031 [Stachybotrys chlorohalonata IBT 40285]